MHRNRDTRCRLHGRGRIDIVASTSSSFNTRRKPLVTIGKPTSTTNSLARRTSRTKYTWTLPKKETVISQIESIIIDM
jgi:hypothetical protein